MTGLRLIQPEALAWREPWLWSPGAGTDVWEMFLACSEGNADRVKALVETPESDGLDAKPSCAR